MMDGFDFNGVECFWQVHDQLRRGEDVTGAQWKRLFATPGYAALTASEFLPGSFVERWTAAYHPEAEAQRAAYEAKGDSRYRHFCEVARRRDELERFQSDLARRQDEIIARADRRARLFLPAGHEYRNVAGAALVIFGPDARGYVPVVIDLLYAAGMAERLWLLLAHEAHHQMVAVARGTRIGQAGYSRDDLQWVIDQIHLEGVADIVSSDPEQPGPGFAAAELLAVPAYLAALDRGLQEVARDPERRSEIGARLRGGLRWAGHPVGYYMAAAIVEELGQEALVGAALDPGEFFDAYRRAAAAGGTEGPISVAAVGLVRALAGDG